MNWLPNLYWPLNAVQTVTAAFSGLSAIVALFAAITTLRFAKANQRLNVMTAELKYFEDFRKWADHLANTLTEAIHLCDLDPGKTTGESFFDRRHRLLIDISAMIDRGRWFFPNIEVDDHGAEKELGYRGYRHELLDGVVGAYRCLEKVDYRNQENNKLLRDELTSCKRRFVGQVQQILDPNGQRVFFERIRVEVARMNQRRAAK